MSKTNRLVNVSGSSVRNCVAAAREALGLKLVSGREVIRSGGEDGLYRVHLSTGDVVEASIMQRTPTVVSSVCDLAA